MKDSFSVIQITDTHIEESPDNLLYGFNTWQSFNQVINHIMKNTLQPDFLLLTGDLSNDGTTKSYELIKQALTKLNITSYSINGNHDNKKNLAQSLNEGIFKPDKIIHKKNWLFILLDSCIDGEIPGYLTNSELAFLQQTLEANKGKQTVICLHHHPFKMHNFMDKYNLINAKKFISLIEKFNQVKLVIFGHIHQDFSAVVNGIHFVGTPSTCMQISPYKEKFAKDNLAPGYRVFDFWDSGYYTTVKRIS